MPLLVQIHAFEAEFCVYAQKRRYTSCQSTTGQRSQAQDLQQGMSMAWLSTLFALLACGSQFANEDLSTRQQQSALYGEHAPLLKAPSSICSC